MRRTPRCRRVAAGAAALLWCCALAGCQSAPPRDLQRGLVAWRQDRVSEADSLFARAVAASPRDPLARVWYAESSRRLGRYGEAVSEASRALAARPSLAMAHTVIAACYDPVISRWGQVDLDSCRARLDTAVETDPGEAEAWLSIWKFAVADGDTARERHALLMVSARGYLAPAALEYGRWMLETLPDRALLLTHGDLDTYPAAQVQALESLRPDVAVANVALLGWSPYAAAIADRHGLGLPGKEVLGTDATGPAIARTWIEQAGRGALGRPLALAVTVSDPTLREPPGVSMRLVGGAYVVRPDTAGAAADLALLRLAVDRLDPKRFGGRYVTPKDRSPVRQATADQLAANLVAVALRYGHLAADAGDPAGARFAADRAAALARVAPAGRVPADFLERELADLRGRSAAATPGPTAPAR